MEWMELLLCCGRRRRRGAADVVRKPCFVSISLFWLEGGPHRKLARKTMMGQNFYVCPTTRYVGILFTGRCGGAWANRTLYKNMLTRTLIDTIKSCCFKTKKDRDNPVLYEGRTKMYQRQICPFCPTLVHFCTTLVHFCTILITKSSTRARHFLYLESFFLVVLTKADQPGNDKIVVTDEEVLLLCFVAVKQQKKLQGCDKFVPRDKNVPSVLP